MSKELIVKKKCNRCLKLKDASEYYTRRQSKDGLYTTCKTCLDQQDQNHAYPSGKKRCSKCGKEKNVSLFPINRRLTGGLHTYCRACVKIKRNEVNRDYARRIHEYFGGRCAVCNESHDDIYRVFHCHHIKPDNKRFCVKSRNAYMLNWDMYVVPELEKCIYVCANCHAKIEAGCYDKKFIESLQHKKPSSTMS
jgi:hypothetical protein